MRHELKWEHQRTAQEPWEWTTLEPEIRAALAIQVERELAKRSRSGAMVYFVVTIVLALSTPYYRDHPVLLTLAASLSLLLGTMRIAASWRLLRQSPAAPRTRVVFYGSIYAIFVTWGTFCAWTLRLYGPEWTAMFLLLNSAALAAGGSSSLAPNLRLAFRCLACVMAPTIVTTLVLGGARYWAITVVTSIYLGFLLAQTKSNWHAFWTATVAAEREKLRGSAERRQAERERATLVAAIEQAAEEILITDTEGSLQYCNPFFEQATGYSRKEVIGKNLLILQSGTHDAEFYRGLWNSITSGKVWTGRLTSHRKDGSLYEVDATISPIHDASGTLTGFVSSRHDVTERLRLESALRQSQKMEALGRLAGGIAHDFNNLMTIIVGYCEAMRSELASSPSLQKPVNEIYKAAEQANSLTRQLLAFSRRQKLQSSLLNLNSVLTNMSDMLRRLLSDDIELTILTDSTLGLIRANHGQIEQVIMNLVINASQAMPRGGKLVLAATSTRLEEGGGRLPLGGQPGSFVHLTVSDTGIGMDPEVKACIFDPFFTTKEQGKGTGLGLATVYGIVNQADGHIFVESEPDKGTTFHLYFPCVDAAIVSDAPSQLVRPGPTRGSETVLVVDDQEGLCTLLCEILRSNGYSVLLARNGREALRVLREHPRPIDLVITDMVMPQMGGRELAEALRSLRPQTKVLCMSGYTDRAEDVNELLSHGHAFIEKPFTPDALLRKVRDVLATPTNSLHSDRKAQ